MITVEGYIRDSVGQPLSGIPIELFQRHSLGDLNLTTSPVVTANDGYFKINPQKNIDETNSNVYIIITDESKRFVSVRDKHGRYKRKEFFSTGGINGCKWRSPIINNINNIIQVIALQDRIPLPDEYD